MIWYIEIPFEAGLTVVKYLMNVNILTDFGYPDLGSLDLLANTFNLLGCPILMGVPDEGYFRYTSCTKLDIYVFMTYLLRI